MLGVVLSIVSFVSLRDLVPLNSLVFWLALQIALTLLRLRLVSDAQKIDQEDWLEDSIYVRRYAILTFMSGCVWASLLLFVHEGQMLREQVTVFSALAIVIAGSLYLYAASPILQLSFSLPILLPLGGWCFTQQEIIYSWAGTLVMSFLVLQFIFLAAGRRLVSRSVEVFQDQGRRLDLVEEENSALLAHVAKIDHSEVELQRDRQLFLDGPVVRYRCVASDGWPIVRMSNNAIQFGYDAEDLETGVRFIDWIHPADLGEVLQQFLALDAGRPSGMRREYRLRCEDGTFCWVHDYTLPVFNDSGQLTHLDGYLLDINRLYEANEALAKEKERAQVTLESIGDAVITTDREGRIDFMNSVAEKLTGWTFSLARYSPLADVFRIRQEESGMVSDPVQSFLDSTDLGDGRQKEADLYSRQGLRTLITYNAAPIRSKDDRLMGHVLVFLDVTDKRDLQRELEFQARHDVLTGLLNRREFEKRLIALIATEGEHVLLYIDLDQFKLVNDTCGHAAGDELLIQLTHGLQKYLRPEDTFARLGGDEFGVLLENCGLERGQEIAQIIRAGVRQFQFSWEGRAFEIGASIGMVAIDDSSHSIAQVMSAADIACYSAKENGRNRVCVYQDDDKDLLQREVEMDWATRIAQSMEDGLLILYYQDIVPVAMTAQVDNPVQHIEILLRIRDSEGRHVRPEAFLSSAERYNLMPDLDRWVVRHSFEWFSQHRMGGEVRMSINLSGLTLTDSEFVSTVKRLLNEYDVPASSVCFEVTETAAIASLATAADFMEELKSLGCQFSLDDFGSGLSSFAYLKALPVDYLKIDGNFVRNILTNSVDRAMVKAINDIGHTMQLKTVAEYVNDIRMLPELEALGIDFAQGYAIARPRKLHELRGPASVQMGLSREMPLSLH